MNNISIIGIGRLGLCAALCFEKAGYNVLGVDVSQDYVNSINNKSFASAEPFVNEYLQASTKFKGTTSLEEGIQFSDSLFVLVQTPNGGGDKYYDHSILSNVLHKLNTYALVNKHIIICCTVMPEYIRTVGKALLSDCKGCTLNYNPEFIAQGNIIRGFESPDIVLIGEENTVAGDYLESVYAKVCVNKPQICRMPPIDAEITKIALNGFITTKIAYCNMIGELCDTLGANKDIVAAAIGSDSRVGNKYFKPGFSYGGPCFPRDTRALSKCISDVGLKSFVPLAVDEQNKYHVQFDANKLYNKAHQDNRYKAIPAIAYADGSPYTHPLIVKLTNLCYKEGSKIPIIEESAKLKIAKLLVQRGCKVILQDVKCIIDEIKKEYGNMFTYEFE